MAFHSGSKKMGKVYKGSAKIGKVYKGSTLLYRSIQNFSGSLYAWKDHGSASSPYYGSGYSTFNITVNATKDSDKGKNPTQDGGTTTSYGYVDIVGANGKTTTVVGRGYGDRTGSVSGKLSDYGGSFKVHAYGWAGEVTFNGTLS